MTLADQLTIAPVVIPAVVAPLTLLAMPRRRALAVGLSLAGCVAMLAAAVALFGLVQDNAIRSYALGGWPAPFGIVLVLDRLSAAMLALSSILALVVLLHATLTAADRQGSHFHPLFHFQLLGLNGAFLTGDLFNLFVFFEVLLIASYGLMLHGQGAARLKAGVGYVVVNIVGSALFLIALGVLYGVTGTLNMADLARRIAVSGAADEGMLRIAGVLLMTVFALKAAIVPLHLWLPRTYVATMPAVAALFAILTKVGVYAMIRIVPLLFGEGAGALAWIPSPWLFPAAVMTAVIGFAGVFVAQAMREQAAFALVGSTGTLVLAVSCWTQATMAAALFYLVHATLAGAALFLVADVTMRRRGQYDDVAVPSPRFAGQQATGLLFLASSIAAVGLPPLSGFIGKLFILQTTATTPNWMVLWATVLGTTLVGIIGFARTGSILFWKASPSGADPIDGPNRSNADLIAPTILIGLLAALTIGAGWATAQAQATAAQIFAPQRYIAAVLGSVPR
ncbi:monovalent cation/H+ antiporter subunit D [Sphingomonas sp. Leaf242]|uniref:monovalent cation/H+ antiporter subunit D n=1 Tax=Sphingomonas sp. Leaf242 TaxID=1736304 RepID=UPI000714D8B2|nr:monovalent cation/H+ antiporter subunit D [Sphingomonas sp. Leaf242]KQO09168.1 cation:proton antiporter [Sphingomonas sp. Leaf242]